MPPDPDPILSPYQEEAVHEIATNLHMPHRYLADEQGLGKTIEALNVLMRWLVRVCLVVCPASAIGVWQRETRIWWPDATVITPHGPRGAFNLRRLGDPRQRHLATLVLLSYDLLSRAAEAWVHTAAVLRPDAVICDEAHRLKADRSLRTRAVFGARLDTRNSITAGVPHVLLLSGTPMTAYAADLWPALHALWPERIWISAANRQPMSQHEYETRFCDLVDQGFGPRPVGNRNGLELRRRLHGKGNPVFVRRTKLAVLKDLPPCRIVLTPLTIPVTAPPLDILPAELHTYSDQRLDAWVTANTDTTATATARRTLGEFKLNPALAWIIDWLEDNPDDKLIVFGVHRVVLDTIHATLDQRSLHPVLLHGGTSTQDRAQLIAQFQSLKSHRVFVGQLQAAGESITLTAASTVVFVETDWSHTALVQALSRAHRRGQTQPVLGHVLIVPDTLDERIHAVAVRKARAATALWGDTKSAAAD